MNERDRIELLMKSYNLSPSQFADKTGIQRASVSHILSGRNKPSLEVMLKIYEAFPGLSMEWLMAGIGEGPSAAPVIKEESVQSAAGLFAAFDDVVEAETLSNPAINEVLTDVVARKNRAEKPRRDDAAVQVEKGVRRASQARTTVQTAVAQRKIKEIRVFYTDGTYEVLLPERG